MPKEFGDAFRFWLAPIPMPAEGPEVDLGADGRILPDRGKSVVAGNSKFKIQNHQYFTTDITFGEKLKKHIALVHENVYRM